MGGSYDIQNTRSIIPCCCRKCEECLSEWDRTCAMPTVTQQFKPGQSYPEMLAFHSQFSGISNPGRKIAFSKLISVIYDCERGFSLCFILLWKHQVKSITTSQEYLLSGLLNYRLLFAPESWHVLELFGRTTPVFTGHQYYSKHCNLPVSKSFYLSWQQSTIINCQTVCISIVAGGGSQIE